MVGSACDFPPERIRRLLDDDLPEIEVNELAAHLEHCPQCCRRLDTIAAKSGDWADLRLLNDGDEFDRRTTFGNRDIDRSRHGEPDEFVIPTGLLDPPSDPANLGRLGPYEILEVVGQGGMGIVFRARDEALDRLVAIKVLVPGLASTAAARRRFAREARAAAAVVNEHVVAIYAVDTTPQGVPYLVMQYVAGKSAQDLVDQGEPPQVCQILRIGMQAAQALAAAHAQGLIHRDVKPANILLENGVERVKITDFGLARAVDDATMTQAGVVAGTPRYMAPEQARGDAIDHRADLFSLGSVLYALCTGRAPFLGSSSIATLKKVCEEIPTPIATLNPELPGWLVRIIECLHAKDPSDRYGSAAEVADLLGRCLAHVQEPGSVALPPELVDRPVRRNRRIRWAACACLLAGIAGVFLGGPVVSQQVADYVATVLRLQTSEGVLIIESDDPNITIQIDGNNLVVNGAGVKELRLPIGLHTVKAVKDGTTVQSEKVTIMRGGRKTLSIRTEEDSPSPGVMRLDLHDAVEAFKTMESAKKGQPPVPKPDSNRPGANGPQTHDIRTTPTARGSMPNATVMRSWAERKALADKNSANGVLTWNLQRKGARSDVEVPGPLRVLDGHSTEIHTVAFSPDGKTLASGTKDGMIILWAVPPQGETLESRQIACHDTAVESVAFSPDGKAHGFGGAGSSCQALGSARKRRLDQATLVLGGNLWRRTPGCLQPGWKERRDWQC